MHENSSSAVLSQSLPSIVGKGLALCIGQSKKSADLAKPEATEVPVQSVEMSSMKASRHSQPELKLLAWLQSLVLIDFFQLKKY